MKSTQIPLSNEKQRADLPTTATLHPSGTTVGNEGKPILAHPLTGEMSLGEFPAPDGSYLRYRVITVGQAQDYQNDATIGTFQPGWTYALSGSRFGGLIVLAALGPQSLAENDAYQVLQTPQQGGGVKEVFYPIHYDLQTDTIGGRFDDSAYAKLDQNNRFTQDQYFPSIVAGSPGIPFLNIPPTPSSTRMLMLNGAGLAIHREALGVTGTTNSIGFIYDAALYEGGASFSQITKDANTPTYSDERKVIVANGFISYNRIINGVAQGNTGDAEGFSIFNNNYTGPRGSLSTDYRQNGVTFHRAAKTAGGSIVAKDVSLLVSDRTDGDTQLTLTADHVQVNRGPREALDIVNKGYVDLMVSGTPIPRWTPDYTATVDGVQSITVPTAGTFVHNVLLEEVSGYNRIINPRSYSINGTTVTITANAAIIAGDKISILYQ